MHDAEANYKGEMSKKGKVSAKAKYNYELMRKAQGQMSDLNKQEREAHQKGDQKAIDKINRKQLTCARDALKMYREK